MNNKPVSPRYKWYILTLTAATYGLIAGAARWCIPVLFKEIATDLDLSLSQIGLVWGMDPLAGILVGLPSGLLTDRFGIKKTLAVSCLLAAVLGALRGFSFNFLSLSATVFLFGLIVAALPSIVPKVTTLWFSGKQLGLANALLNVAGSVGAMIATISSATLLSPWLGGWERVMFLFGAPAVILGLLWYLTGREPAKMELTNTPLKPILLREALSRVVHVREVWVLALITLCTWGANMGFIGYIPTYLRDIGWTPGAADSAMTALSGATMIGLLPTVILSDRTGSRRGIFVLSMVMLAAGLALLPFVEGGGIWAVLLFSGFIRGGGPTLLTVMVFENKEVGAVYGGTAIGLTSAIGMAGGFISPPIGNSLAELTVDLPLVGDLGLALPFLFWAGLAFLAIPLVLLLRKRR